MPPRGLPMVRGRADTDTPIDAGEGCDAGTPSDAVGRVREEPGILTGAGRFEQEEGKMAHPATRSAPPCKLTRVDTAGHWGIGKRVRGEPKTR